MRKNHSKIVCIKLVHLPYLLIYMVHGHTYIKLSSCVNLLLWCAQLKWCFLETSLCCLSK